MCSLSKELWETLVQMRTCTDKLLAFVVGNVVGQANKACFHKEGSELFEIHGFLSSVG